MKAPNSRELQKSIIKEVKNHIEQTHWWIIPREQGTKGEQVLPYIWEFKQKRNIKTKQVIKHKARLNIHCRKQRYPSNFFKMFSPAVNWFTVMMELVLFIIYICSKQQVDFVQAFPQANIEFDMYTEITQGITTNEGSRTAYVLSLLKNLYGLRQ